MKIFLNKANFMQQKLPLVSSTITMYGLDQADEP